MPDWQELSDDELSARLRQRNPSSSWNFDALVQDRDDPDGAAIISDMLS